MIYYTILHYTILHYTILYCMKPYHTILISQGLRGLTELADLAIVLGANARLSKDAYSMI